MKNCDYIQAKQMIEKGETIEAKTFEELCKLKKTYCDGIAEEIAKPVQNCDNNWLAKMTQERNEIENLIRLAKVM